MELFVSIICYISGTALILRGFVFFIIKIKAKDQNAKANFLTFLWKDFGQLNQILIWYMAPQKVRIDLNKYIKILNFLTTVILVSIALLILLFVIIYFT